MSGFVFIDADVRAFGSAETDVARANVLLTAPAFPLMLWSDDYRRICRATGFAPGLHYVEALLEAQRRRRHRGVLDTFELGGATNRLLEIVDRSMPARGVDS